MLVDSPRLSDADRQAWGRWAALDARMAVAMRPRLERLADTARQVILDFAAAGPCYASISWGKDSLVLAHLVATSDVAGSVPLGYATSEQVPGRIANPDSARVRDLFLAAYPGVSYVEYPGGLGRLSEHMGTSRVINGVRGAESGIRKRVMRWYGTMTSPDAATCRPIGHWSHAELWAYLHLHDLPVHPAYAMTYGGVLDRSRVRVHSFGGEDGAVEGRIEWEDHYYGDLTDRLRGVTRARPC